MRNGEPIGLLLSLTYTRLLPYGRPVGLLLAITGQPATPAERTRAVDRESRVRAVEAENRTNVVRQS